MIIFYIALATCAGAGLLYLGQWIHARRTTSIVARAAREAANHDQLQSLLLAKMRIEKTKTNAEADIAAVDAEAARRVSDDNMSPADWINARTGAKSVK